MALLPLGIFISAEAKRIRQRQERTASMLESFSAIGVTTAEPALAAAVHPHVHDWIASQLGRPETASFHDEIARVTPDQTLLLLGRADSLNVTGTRCSNWFIVEFDLVRNQSIGAMLETKPHYLAEPPMLQVLPGTELSYARPAPTREPESPPTDWLLNLSIAVVVVIVVSAIVWALNHWG